MGRLGLPADLPSSLELCVHGDVWFLSYALLIGILTCPCCLGVRCLRAEPRIAHNEAYDIKCVVAVRYTQTV